MKKIYRVHDTHNGGGVWCLKKNLNETINTVEGKMRVAYMDEYKLNPKSASGCMTDIADHVSDYLEVVGFENEESLITALNLDNSGI